MKRWQVIEDLVKRHDWRRGAELGVFKGETFLYLLERCPRLHLIGVDRWEPTPAPVSKSHETGQKDYSATPMAEYEAAVRSGAERFGSRAEIMKMGTVEAAALVPNSSLDFVFIDACHETAAVTADIEAWRPKLRPGGWLMGHDANWPSVRRAIDALVPGWRPYANNMWADR